MFDENLEMELDELKKKENIALEKIKGLLVSLIDQDEEYFQRKLGEYRAEFNDAFYKQMAIYQGRK